MKQFDVIVIGGGAAGLMCALSAGQRGRRVVVLESSNKIGKKILMSGGGRCNFTNLYCEPSRFLSANPHFCVSALHRFTQWDFIALVEKHGIAYHEKAAGQLFCDLSSKQIVAMLQTECAQAGVLIQTHCTIAAVAERRGYEVRSDQGRFHAPSLVVACGGLSIPRMGASDFGYRLARQFGIDVLPTRAGLVPFCFTGPMQALTERLAGVSLPARLSNAAASFTDDILFTHRGLSGPASLQLSSYWQAGETVSLDLFAGLDAGERLVQAKRMQPRTRLRTLLTETLPRALVLELQLLLWTDFAEMALAEIADDKLRTLGQNLSNWALRPSGTEGYRTAEVTLGGVDTAELSSKTMQSRRHPGLYFIGEVVDVTGHLGGFNFQWAWASGFAAAQWV